MILLLTLAGRDARFRSEGFNTPKYLLPWGDKTILSAILAEFMRDKAFSDVRLVANAADHAYMPHVRAILAAQGIQADRLTLTEDTGGQAATAMIGLTAIEEAHGGEVDEAVLISNIDTVLYGRNIQQMGEVLRAADGFVDIFKSNDRSYSYVLLGENGRVQEIAEKIVVSNLATSGCYGFRDARTFRAHYHEDDKYISSVLNTMLKRGATVMAGERHTEDDTIVLSSPDEYMNATLVRL